MSQGIIPLRPKGGDQSALARIDVAAVALLADGQALSLQAARAEAILTDLRLQRDEMALVLAGLRERELTGAPEIDTANTNLVTAIRQGIVQIDLFIAQTRSLLEKTLQSAVPQLGASGQRPKGA